MPDWDAVKAKMDSAPKGAASKDPILLVRHMRELIELALDETAAGIVKKATKKTAISSSGEKADAAAEETQQCLEKELAEKDAEFAKKDAELATKDAELAKKDAELAKKDAELEEAKAEYVQSNAGLQARNAELQARNDALCTSQKALQADVAAKTSDLDAARQSNAKLLAESAKLRSDNEVTQGEAATASHKLKLANNEVARLRPLTTEVTKMQQQLTQVTEASAVEVSKLEKAMAVLQEDRDEADKENQAAFEAWEKAVAERDAELHNRTDRIVQLELDNAALLQRVRQLEALLGTAHESDAEGGSEQGDDHHETEEEEGEDQEKEVKIEEEEDEDEDSEELETIIEETEEEEAASRRASLLATSPPKAPALSPRAAALSDTDAASDSEHGNDDDDDDDNRDSDADAAGDDNEAVDDVVDDEEGVDVGDVYGEGDDDHDDHNAAEEEEEGEHDVPYSPVGSMAEPRSPCSSMRRTGRAAVRQRHHLRAPSNVPLAYHGAEEEAAVAAVAEAGVAEAPAAAAAVVPAAAVYDDGRMFLLELGDSKLRWGVMPFGNADAPTLYGQAHNCIARPAKQSKDMETILLRAGTFSRMYNRARDLGYFAGDDAFYVTMNHPDGGLRGDLELIRPMQRGVVVAPCGDVAGSELVPVLKWCQETARCDFEDDGVHLLVAYKSFWSEAQIGALCQGLLETYQGLKGLRLVDDASLVARAAGVATCCVVCVGEGACSVSPVFMGMLMAGSVLHAGVGGGDIDRYFNSMLQSRFIEGFSTMTERRKLAYVRKLKESDAYVAQNFENECKATRKFQRSVVRTALSTSSSAALAGYSVRSASCDEEHDEFAREIIFDQSGGDELKFKVGCELFHAPELLFQPDLWVDDKAPKNARGLSDMLYEAIMKCDPDIRGEMFSNIIVHGATAQLKGLEERIKEDLLKMLPMRMMWLIDIISITIVKEEDELGIDAPTHVLKGARMLAANHSSGWWLVPAEQPKEGETCKSVNPRTRAYSYL